MRNNIPFDFNFPDIAFGDHMSTYAGNSSTDIYPTPQQSCQHDPMLALHPNKDVALDLNEGGVGVGPIFPASFEDRSPTSSARELFDLCGDIVEDQDILTSGLRSSSHAGSTDYLEAEVQRVLNSTSRLSELVKGFISSEAPPPMQDGKIRLNGDQSRPQSDGTTITCAIQPRRNPQDILLKTSMVTAYMYLVRNWRRTFMHIHELLASTPVETDRRKSLLLPGLQLGGFHVHNMPNIQVLVLLELSSVMMRTIKDCLGLSASFGSAHGSMRTDGVGSGRKHTLDMDPVSMSIGELMASQELQSPVSSDEFGKLALEDMMAKIRSQLSIRA